MTYTKSNQSDFSQLLKEGMNQILHWFPEDFSISSFADTITGMANTDGGQVYIGIAPRANQITGISDPQATTDNVFQACLLTDPPIIIPIPQLITQQDQSLLKVVIPKGLPHVFSVEGRYLGRNGRHTTPLSAPKLRELLITRGVVHFEAQVPPGSLFQIWIQKRPTITSKFWACQINPHHKKS